MIIFSGVENINAHMRFLVFVNEKDKSVKIPVPTSIAGLIQSHLNLLSVKDQEEVEYGNEEELEEDE